MTIAPELTRTDRRRLIAAARTLLHHEECPELKLTWAFIRQLEMIVDANVCMKCGGRAWIEREGEACTACDGTGVA